MTNTLGLLNVAERARERRFACVLLSTSALLCPTPGWSQAASNILPPTREEITREKPTPPPLPAPRLEVEGAIERAPCALDGPEFANIRLTVRDVRFDGLKAISADALRSAYAPYVGTDQPISVVCEIRDRAGTILRNAGYIAAVQVPEQKIADGVVRFNVLMAHVAQVRVRGDATGAERIIAGYLGRLTEQPAFNRYEAERYLLLAGDLPGYTVRLTLRPEGTTPGEVIGDVTVQRTPVYADANIQNGGSRELGRWGGLLRSQFYGLTGLADRTVVSAFTTSDLQEQQTLQLGHDFRLGGEGLSLGGLFTYAWARPSIPDADVKARTLLATVQADYPFVRRLSHSLRGSIGMDFVNQDVDLDGIDLSRDRLRVAFARLGMEASSAKLTRPMSLFDEPRWRMSALLELRKGLDILNASPHCVSDTASCFDADEVPTTRPEGRATAAVLRYSAYGEFRPTPRFTFALGASGQYSRKALLSFEEYSAGNYTIGRGYDPGTLLGDSGFGTQAEIRFGSRIPKAAGRPAIEGYAFYDHALVRNRDRLLVLDQSNHLDSVGAGARISFSRFALDAALALPLTRVGLFDRKPDPRFLINLTSRLWPWSYN